MTRKLTFGLLLVLFCSLFTAGTLHAQASNPQQQGSVGLEGVIPSAPPTVGASINIPSNGQTFSNIPIDVRGICPDGLLVKLFKNGVFTGSAQCEGGSFKITTDLFSGANELVAKVYDALDQEGPESNKVTVNFNDVGFGSSRSRVTLTSNFAKRGANPGDTLTWPILLSGGIAPYALSVDWGDGKIELISRANAGSFDIKHVYSEPGVYNLIIKATDSNQATAFLQLTAIANGAVSDNTSGTKPETVKTVIVWWPMLIAILLIMLSFWLGRRHKLYELSKTLEDKGPSGV